jgi:hypothetical protein
MFISQYNNSLSSPFTFRRGVTLRLRKSIACIIGLRARSKLLYICVTAALPRGNLKCLYHDFGVCISRKLKLPDMTSKGELQISFPLYYCNKILLLTSCPVTLRANKIHQDEIFQ